MSVFKQFQLLATESLLALPKENEGVLTGSVLLQMYRNLCKVRRDGKNKGPDGGVEHWFWMMVSLNTSVPLKQ